MSQPELSQIRDDLSRTRDLSVSSVLFRGRDFVEGKASVGVKVTGVAGANRLREEDDTLAGRIRIGMVTAGIQTPAELARRAKIHRQAVHKYLNGENEKLTPEKLYRLSDALNVNARWLALGPPHTPVKPKFLDPDMHELVQIKETLDKVDSDHAREAIEAWVSHGRNLVKLLTPASPANPFPTKRKVRV